MQVSSLSNTNYLVKMQSLKTLELQEQQEQQEHHSISAFTQKMDTLQIGSDATTQDIGIYAPNHTLQKSVQYTEIASNLQTENRIASLSDGKALTQENINLTERTNTLSVPNEMTISSIPNRIITYYTGHAQFDNAITDALQGQSTDFKEQVYDILRNNFFPAYANNDLSESDRQAMIGFGLAHAEYLANQQFDADTKKSFLEAMTGLARIATQGTKNPDGTMQYNIQKTIQLDGNGHVMPNQMQEILYTMEKESPEDFATYQNLQKNSDEQASHFAWDWIWQSQNLQLMFQNRTDYQKAQQKYYKDLESISVDQTFANIDTSNKENFLSSMQTQIAKVENPDFFWKLFQQMSKKKSIIILSQIEHRLFTTAI